jgi:hypothetical protein
MTAAIVAALGGAAALLHPLVRPGSTWTWPLDGPGALVGATVNAETGSVDASGATLRRRGSRPVSLLTPPLAWPGSMHRTLVVRAWLPESTETEPAAQLVRLLWQESPAPEFRFVERLCRLGHQPMDLEFDLPAEPDRIHRVGVQFPSLAGPIVIQSMRVPDLSAVGRLGVILRGALAVEPVGNHSINFLRGPAMQGHSLNYYLLAGVVACGGAYSAIRLYQRRVPRWQTLAGVGLAAWLLLDARATWSLTTQLRLEAGEIRGLSSAELVAATSGVEIGWAFDELSRAAAGSTYAVVSDDPFTAPHRLAYALAPGRTRVDAYERARFIVVVHSSAARFDTEAGRFAAGSGPVIDVRCIARFSEGVYLLERVQP